MNTENEMNEEVRQLLDSLEEHGKNARRQKELGDLIDRLANNESGTVPSLRGGTTKQSRGSACFLDCFVPRNDVPVPNSFSDNWSIKSPSSFCRRAFFPCSSRLSSSWRTSSFISFSVFILVSPYIVLWLHATTCRRAKALHTHGCCSCPSPFRFLPR